MVEDFAGLRIASLLVLGKDQLVIYMNVKDPGISLDENRFKASDLLDCGRQTGGPGEVVSTHAVRNRNFH